MQDEARIKACLYELSVAYPSAKPLTELQVHVYLKGLADLSISQITGACAAAIKACRFFPSVAELRDHAGVSPADQQAFETARAWALVADAVRRYDYTTNVDFGPAINATVRNLGGWLRLCNAGEDRLDIWLRKQFEEIYPLMLTRMDGMPDTGLPLAGAYPGPVVRIGPAATTALVPTPKHQGPRTAAAILGTR